MSVQELANDVRDSTAEACALVAEIHRIRHIENDFHRGYNAAVTEIAAKIREIKQGKV